MPDLFRPDEPDKPIHEVGFSRRGRRLIVDVSGGHRVLVVQREQLDHVDYVCGHLLGDDSVDWLHQRFATEQEAIKAALDELEENRPSPDPDRVETTIVERLDGFTSQPIKVRVTTWYNAKGEVERVDEAF